MCAHGAVVLGPVAGCKAGVETVDLKGDAVQALCCVGDVSLNTCLVFCGVFRSVFHSVFDDLPFTPSSCTWL